METRKLLDKIHEISKKAKFKLIIECNYCSKISKPKISSHKLINPKTFPRRLMPLFSNIYYVFENFPGNLILKSAKHREGYQIDLEYKVKMNLTIV